MKAISYSLFGYGQKAPKYCFEFETYLRGMWTNMRVNRVIYPGWKMIVNMDSATINGEYQSIFVWLAVNNLATFIERGPAKLCEAMLWRLSPVFDVSEETGTWKYTHVLCRDIDSISTYREAQMVKQWIEEDKAIHCITDSISHNIPMMGGMIGVRPAYLTERLKCNTWDEFTRLYGSRDLSIKGSDQDFLNRVIYPRCSDSATEHFILGMKHTIPEGDGRHYQVPINVLEDVPLEQACTNDLAGHVGAAGCYEPVMVKWLNTMDPYIDDYAEIEKQFPRLFFWRQ